ncbi:hypothetical protein OUZ56_024686 [Daphnia magna]|uniref:Uncharacterized protein n=1 Tax=Daphnia magna TaxID=35525 RepID=A0ABR0B1D9_9CRUS|nr:hypothetical protein OUZ56_024686 [Daphnia magna]
MASMLVREEKVSLLRRARSVICSGRNEIPLDKTSVANDRMSAGLAPDSSRNSSIWFINSSTCCVEDPCGSQLQGRHELFEVQREKAFLEFSLFAMWHGFAIEAIHIALIATYLRLSEDKRCDCPYTIHEEYWCNGLSIAGKMPLVTNLDLVNYLLCSKSPYTHEDLKAYKGLETYKRFIDGGIGSFCAISLLNKNLLMKAKGWGPVWVCFSSVLKRIRNVRPKENSLLNNFIVATDV